MDAWEASALTWEAWERWRIASEEDGEVMERIFALMRGQAALGELKIILPAPASDFIEDFRRWLQTLGYRVTPQEDGSVMIDWIGWV